MRSRDERQVARVFGLSGVAAFAVALGACSASERLAQADPVPNGPRSDYPVVIGAPYSIGDVDYAPEDVLNYDEVGYLAVDNGGSGMSASHHTLPLPSYVEVTSLATGRTILVRVERRGPMSGHALLALSPGALEQLGDGAGAPVRVRRVNPPEDQRALLRDGLPAPLRMDTPMPLVEVLRRKLPEHAAPTEPVQVVEAAPVVEANPEPSPDRAADGFLVQAASFSTADRAERAAHALAGFVRPSGKYFRVQTGPFATRGEAEASLAKVRAAGYTDARIFKSG